MLVARRLLNEATTYALVFFISTPVSAEIGRLLFVNGNVSITRVSGKSEPAQKDSRIDQGDSVKSENGVAQIRMVDGAILLVRENSDIKFDKYQFNAKNPGSDDALISMVKGGLRSITGFLGNRNKEKFKVATPTATIGIRGTDKEIRVVLPPLPGQTALAPSGTYAKLNVQVGNPSQLVMATQVGSVVISPNQVGYASSPGAPPSILPAVPAFMASSTAAPAAKKVAAAAPADRAEQKAQPTSEERAKASGQGGSGQGSGGGQQNQSQGGDQQPTAPSGGSGAGNQNSSASSNAQTRPDQPSQPAAPTQQGPAATPSNTPTAVDGAGQLTTAAGPSPQAASPISPSLPAEGGPVLPQAPSSVDAPEPVRVRIAPVANVDAGSLAPLNVVPQTTVVSVQPVVVSVSSAVSEPTVLTKVEATATTASGETQTFSASEQTLTQGNIEYSVEQNTTTNTATSTTTQGGLSASGGSVSLADYGALSLQESSSALNSYSLISTLLTDLSVISASAISAVQASSEALAAYGSSTAAGSLVANATSIGSVAAIDAALASSNFNSADSLKNTATTLVGDSSGGVTKFYQDNATFRDGQASAAFTSMNSALQSLSTAHSVLSAAKDTASVKSQLLVDYQALSASKKSTAEAALVSVQALESQISLLSQAVAGTQNISLTITDLNSTAKTVSDNAANYASLAVTATNAGDLNQASAMYEAAKSERLKADNLYAIAGKLKSAINDGNTVVALKLELVNLLASVTTVKQEGDAAVTTTTSALSSVNSYLSQVQQQSVIAQYTNPANATTERFGHVSFGSKTESPPSAVSSVGQNKANTSYVLDGSRNLVEIRDAPFVTKYLSIADIDYSSANINISGGTSFESSGNAYVDSVNGSIYYGRWTGSTVTVDNQAGATKTYSLGNQSLHWLIGYSPAENYARSLQGEASYSLVGNTKPTDMAGNLGVLTSANLTANFNAQTVNAVIAVDIASKTLSMATGSMPIGGNNAFAAQYSTVGCSGSGCGTSYWDGRVNGQFFGENALYAGLGYQMTTLNSTYTGLADSIQGVALFKAASAPILKNGLNFTHSYLAYSYSGGGYSSSPLLLQAESYSVEPENYTQAAIGGGVYPLTLKEMDKSLSVTAPVSVGYSTVSLAGGEWAAYGRGEPQGTTNVELQISPTDNSAGYYQKVYGPYSWVSGPYASSPFTALALTTTATYQYGGGWVENNGGGAGSFDSTATSLTVDFNRQKVALNISGVVPLGGSNVTFSLSHAGMGLVGEEFRASSSNYDASLNTNIAGSSSAASRISGSLLGSGLQGAGVSFAILDSATSGVPSAIGSVVFKAPGSQTIEPFYIGLTSLGASFGKYVSNPGDLLYMVRPAVTTASRIAFTTDGYLKTFDTQLPKSLSDTSFFPTQLNFASTAILDKGKDPVTGISWGRYSPGGYMENVSMTDRTNSNATYSSRSSMGPAGEGWHAIFSTLQNSVPVIPVVGSHTYTFVGGTLPTDTNGFIASAAPAATLTADFSKQLVNVTVPQFSLKDSAGAVQSSWSASTAAGGVPIARNAYFSASTGAGNLSVSTTASGVVAGRLSGAFVGDFSAANAGALIGYSLNAGGATGTTVSGVSAFRK
jgi:hypothetical protein